MCHCIGVMEPTSIVLEQNRSRRDGAKAPCELPLCKRGLRPFPVFVLQLTGKATGASCARSPVFLLLFTGKQGRRMGQAHARSLIAAGRLAMLAAVQGDNGAR